MTNLNRFGILLAFFIFFILLACFSSFSTDDTYISYRFATNMSKGHGLVFNSGQAPVEGYTNFLWTVILSGIASVLLPLPATAQFLSAFFGVGLIILMGIWAFRQQAFSENHFPAIPMIILASSPFVAIWANTGMETIFFTFLLVLGCIFLSIEERNEWIGILSGLVFALAALTRPDGLLLGGLIILFSFIESSEWGTRFIAFIIRSIIFLLPPGLHILWRKSYYGQWLPNTFYAKTASGTQLVDHGLDYLQAFMLNGGLILVVLMVLSIFVRPRIDGIWTLLVTTIVYCSYIVWVGGDWMPGYRMFVPILPLMIMGASIFIGKSFDASPKFALFLCLAVMVHFLYSGLTTQAMFMRNSVIAQRILGDEPPVDVLRELGMHLKEVSSGSELIAVIPAGKVPYFSGLRAIDMRGLCDAHIAHTEVKAELKHQLMGHLKRDPEYVLRQRPDYIVLTGARLKPGAEIPDLNDRGGAPILDEWSITRLPEFKENYKEVIVQLPRGSKDLLYYKREEGYGPGGSHAKKIRIETTTEEDAQNSES